MSVEVLEASAGGAMPRCLVHAARYRHGWLPDRFALLDGVCAALLAACGRGEARVGISVWVAAVPRDPSGAPQGGAWGRRRCAVTEAEPGLRIRLEFEPGSPGRPTAVIGVAGLHARRASEAAEALRAVELALGWACEGKGRASVDVCVEGEPEAPPAGEPGELVVSRDASPVSLGGATVE